MKPADLRAAAAAMYDGFGGASLWAPPVGLVAGTPVETPQGDVPVDRLRPGDLVGTQEGPRLKLAGITRRPVAAETLALATRLRPIRVRAHALGHLTPRKDVLLAPGQMLRWRGVTAPVAELVNGISVRQRDVAQAVIYYAPRLEAPGTLLAEGLGCPTAPVETDADAILRLRAELAALAGLVPGQLHGNIARLAHDGVEGWAVDLSHPGLKVGLEIVVDGAVAARTLANRARPDLEMAGLGHCAFAVRFRRKLSAARDHTLQIRRIDDRADMPGSPVLLPAARGDAATLAAALQARMDAARDDPSRAALADFLAGQIDVLVQSLVDRPKT